MNEIDKTLWERIERLEEQMKNVLDVLNEEIQQTTSIQVEITELKEQIEALEAQVDINKKQYLSETNELGNIITKLTQRVKKLEDTPRVVYRHRGGLNG